MTSPSRSLWLVVLAGLGAGFLTERVRELELQLSHLRSSSAEREDVARLTEGLAGLNDELAVARSEQTCEQALLDERLQTLEGLLVQTGSELSQQEDRLRSWAAVWEGRDPTEIESRIEEVRESVEQRKRDLEQLTREAMRLASEERANIEALDRRLDPLESARDPQRLWTECVGPVVQLAGDSTVGSGVLIESRPLANGEGHETYMLTAWHVVRDIYGSPEKVNQPVHARIYLEDGTTTVEAARMVAYDTALDVALLKLDTDRAIPNGARLASRESLERAKIFDGIYAVGCPLGNDPIPTAGEIAATNHKVDGCTYWMISAPTYIGNSGGGIFDARSHELMGIFSKIYTHGATRSTIVPHMGLATPLSKVYDWLEGAGRPDIVPGPMTIGPQTASAPR